MQKREVENAVMDMADVGVLIYMIDKSFSLPGDEEGTRLERAILLLKDTFESRYADLRGAYYGGEARA